MSRLDNQTLFDTVARHLLTQGKRSGRIIPARFGGDATKFECLYRGPDDCKCAAGAILPDEMYFPEMEGTTVINSPEYPWAELVDDLALLRLLQRVHDIRHGQFSLVDYREEPVTNLDVDPAALWPDRLRAVAERYGFDPKVLDEKK